MVSSKWSEKKKMRLTIIVSFIFIFKNLVVFATENTQNSIEELFGNSMLAVASYVPFEGGEGDKVKLLKGLEHDKSDWKGDENILKRKISTDRFTYLHHLPDTASSFSTTLFKCIDGGKITFASKGSAEIMGDFAVADVVGIGFSGVPQYQVADLYNYVQQLKAPSKHIPWVLMKNREST